MGQNKEELKKLLSFIATLAEQPGNEEFVAGLRALLLSSTPGVENAKLEEIYEYCIERNSRNQGTDLYKNFPINEIRDELVESYVLMESFRRRGDFLNFCAHLFKQIEGIANYICSLPEYQQIFTELLDCPSIFKYSKETKADRDPESPSVYMLIYDGYGQTSDGKDKKDTPLPKQYIQDKIKIAMYLAGYASCLYSHSEFKTFSFNISKLYLARCEADHSGNLRTEKQEATFKETVANPGKYYIEFMSLLNSFIGKISVGYNAKDNLFNFARFYGAVEYKGVVSSVLPGAMFIQINGEKPQQVPYDAYDHRTCFNEGDIVNVMVKKGTIVRVETRPAL